MKYLQGLFLAVVGAFIFPFFIAIIVNTGISPRTGFVELAYIDAIFYYAVALLMYIIGYICVGDLERFTIDKAVTSFFGLALLYGPVLVVLTYILNLIFPIN
jgi:hypothetical protein